MLECASSDQLGTLLDAVEGVDGEVAAKAAQRFVAEFTRRLRTSPHQQTSRLLFHLPALFSDLFFVHSFFRLFILSTYF